jgi:hypothetical protein
MKIQPDIFEHYATYLSESIADIKFMDKDNLKEYLKTHLNLFYSQCLDDHLLPDLDKRSNFLTQENQRLGLERVKIEEQILIGKSALREGLYVDTTWLAKANYAYKIKGVQMLNNTTEISKIRAIQRRAEKDENIKKSATESRLKLNYIKQQLGKERYDELMNDAHLSIFYQTQNNQLQ